MRKFLFLLITFSILSCSTQFHDEYLEFESSNAVIIGGNRTQIKLIPTNSKRKKNVTVKILYKNNYLDNKRITNEKYLQILNLYEKISIKDTSKVWWLDPPTLEIKYKKGTYQKNFYYYGIPTKDENFRILTDLILETAKLKISDIN